MEGKCKRLKRTRRNIMLWILKDTFIPSGACVPYGRKEDRNKILTLFVMAVTAILVMTGCSNECPEGVNLVDEHDIWWHSNRLTKEEWIKIYGGT